MTTQHAVWARTTCVRLAPSAQQYSAWRTCADAAQISLSEWVRTRLGTTALLLRARVARTPPGERKVTLRVRAAEYAAWRAAAAAVQMRFAVWARVVLDRAATAEMAAGWDLAAASQEERSQEKRQQPLSAT